MHRSHKTNSLILRKALAFSILLHLMGLGIFSAWTLNPQNLLSQRAPIRITEIRIDKPVHKRRSIIGKFNTSKVPIIEKPLIPKLILSNPISPPQSAITSNIQPPQDALPQEPNFIIKESIDFSIHAPSQFIKTVNSLTSTHPWQTLPHRIVLNSISFSKPVSLKISQASERKDFEFLLKEKEYSFSSTYQIKSKRNIINLKPITRFQQPGEPQKPSSKKSLKTNVNRPVKSLTKSVQTYRFNYPNQESRFPPKKTSHTVSLQKNGPHQLLDRSVQKRTIPGVSYIFPDPRVHSSSKPKSNLDLFEGANTDKGNLDDIRNQYIGNVHKRVSLKQYYPPIARKRRYEGESIVQFTLAEDGNLLNVGLQKPSGFNALDQAALDAVVNAQPYPSIPHILKKTVWRFKLPIIFELD